MLDRPIVIENVLSFLRKKSNTLPKYLEDIIKYSQINRVPIIRRETIDFFIFLLSIIKPKKVLEIGTGIGFSALLFSHILCTLKIKRFTIDTIERFKVMSDLATKNFLNHDKNKNIKLHLKDGNEYLKENKNKYDFIFLDCSKSSYIKMMPYALKSLDKDGVVIIDDVFQGGDTLKPIKEVPKKNKLIHKSLNKLINEYKDNPNFIVSFLPLGDGLLMIKNK